MTLGQSIRRALQSECKTDFARIFNFAAVEVGPSANWSQSQIGQILGVSRGYLNMVLNGRRTSKRLMRRLRPYLQNRKRKNQYA